MSGWNGIKERVETNGDVATVTMEDLRDAHGSGKLGVHVRAEISRALAGTPIGDLITTVLTLGSRMTSASASNS